MSGVFGGIETSNHNTLRLHEVVDMVQFPDKQWVELRFLNTAPLQVRQYWIKILGGKDKREIEIPRYSVDFDPTNPKVPKKGVKCPYSELSTGKDGAARASDFWLFNAIDRDMQEEGPPRRATKPTKEELKTGFKDIRSDTWTPVRVVRLTYTMVKRMQELSEDNEVRDKKTGSKKQYDAADAKYGFDVKIKYKKEAAGSDKYTIDKVDGGRKPLTPEEKKYLIWNLSEELLDMTGRKTEAEAREDIKSMTIVGDIPDFGDDDDDMPRKRRSLDDDDDDMPRRKKRPSLDDDDDDDDEDEKPRRKKKRPSLDDDDDDMPRRKKKRPSLDDDEDEKPRRKKRTSDDDEDEKPRRKKRPSLDEDEDEKPRRKKRTSDEDDAPRKKSSTSSTARRKRPASDDRPARSSVKGKAPAKKKRRPAFDDDE